MKDLRLQLLKWFLGIWYGRVNTRIVEEFLSFRRMDALRLRVPMVSQVLGACTAARRLLDSRSTWIGYSTDLAAGRA